MLYRLKLYILFLITSRASRIILFISNYFRVFSFQEYKGTSQANIEFVTDSILSLDLQANTLKRHCKSLLLLAVEVCYIPSAVTFSPTKYDCPSEVPDHREPFLMRLLVGAIVIERKKVLPVPARNQTGVAGSTGKHSTTYITVNAGFYCK